MTVRCAAHAGLGLVRRNHPVDGWVRTRRSEQPPYMLPNLPKFWHRRQACAWSLRPSMGFTSGARPGVSCNSSRPLTSGMSGFMNNASPLLWMYRKVMYHGEINGALPFFRTLVRFMIPCSQDQDLESRTTSNVCTRGRIPSLCFRRSLTMFIVRRLTLRAVV